MRLVAWSAVAAAMLLCLAGCGLGARTLTTGSYAWPEADLTVSLPPGRWQVQEASDRGIVVFRREGQPGRMAVQVTPLRGKSAPPAFVLKRLLFVEFDEKEVIDTWPTRVGGPGPEGLEAECVLVRAREEGQWVMVKACVFSRGGRVYDVVCWSAAGSFVPMDQLFAGFLRGIRLGGRVAPAGAGGAR